MTTPRLILSFFLTTLKNRWTFLPCIFFLFYFTIFFFFVTLPRRVCLQICIISFLYKYIFLSVSLRQWYAAPITEEKMSHHGQISYGFIRYCTLGKKCLSFLFFFRFYFFGSLSVTSWFAGSTEDESEEVSDGQKGREPHEKQYKMQKNTGKEKQQRIAPCTENAKNTKIKRHPSMYFPFFLNKMQTLKITSFADLTS